MNQHEPTRRQDKILDSIADGVFTVDRDWNITSFNRAAEQITGVSREQAVGQKCFDVFRANICQIECALNRTMQTGEEIIDRRVDILDSRGKTVPISISTAVLRDEEDRIVGGVETFRDLSTVEQLRREIRSQYTVSDIVSKSHEIHRILSTLPDIAASDSTVLIEGPSGSGKELFARAIHTASPRARKPFVAVNCGALPDTLLESEIFGYVRGAFTDAKRDKPGRFALAEGGTLFLDEIGDISTALQVKLLRVLQQREYEPLGSTQTVKADVRVIAATHRSLAERVALGAFRDDLYYRLNVVRITLPPLSQRREDIPLLVDHFIDRYNARTGRRIEGVSDRAMALLLRYAYPGNVRELENIIEHAFVLCRGGAISIEHLSADVLQQGPPTEATDLPAAEPPLSQAEISTILDALRRSGGSRTKAAAALGIHPSTLWRKMKRYGIRP